MKNFFELGSVVSTGQGDLLIGWGKRTWYESPQKGDQPFFYFPDYFLSYSKSWFTHEEWKEVSIQEFLEEMNFVSYEKPVWLKPEKKLFSETFEELKQLFQQEILQKAVPFIFEFSTGPMNANLLHGSLKSALQFAEQSPVFIYGFWDQNEGILGATPELLFSMKGQYLQTMAVAGTAPHDRSKNEFLNDPKELREHRFVVEGIEQSLFPFGKVKLGKTDVVTLPTLSHLITPIDLTITSQISIDAIVKALHPTPALGAFPKEQGMNWLKHYQTKIDRKRFGAPAGYLHRDQSRCYVAIRNIQWDENRIAIGAGCGIIRESQHDKEWGEILLKIKSIKRMLSL